MHSDPIFYYFVSNIELFFSIVAGCRWWNNDMQFAGQQACSTFTTSKNYLFLRSFSTLEFHITVAVMLALKHQCLTVRNNLRLLRVNFLFLLNFLLLLEQ